MRDRKPVFGIGMSGLGEGRFVERWRWGMRGERFCRNTERKSRIKLPLRLEPKAQSKAPNVGNPKGARWLGRTIWELEGLGAHVNDEEVGGGGRLGWEERRAGGGKKRWGKHMARPMIALDCTLPNIDKVQLWTERAEKRGGWDADDSVSGAEVNRNFLKTECKRRRYPVHSFLWGVAFKGAAGIWWTFRTQEMVYVFFLSPRSSFIPHARYTHNRHSFRNPA